MFAWIVPLVVCGCGQSERREPSVTKQIVPPAASTTVTLSADRLMFLNWGGLDLGCPTVLDKRAVDAGVEFDIRFPGTDIRARSIDYVSSRSGGQRTLVGLDVGRYKAFALKFTLVSVNGRSDPNLAQAIAVGALIGPAGDGRLSACEPLVLGFSPGRTTGVASTGMHTAKTRTIGIRAHLANPQVWAAEGSVVTLRVEPAPGADILAMPAIVSQPKSRAKSPHVLNFGPRRMGAW
ncbi:MAG: hypothetical protein A2Y77_02590 [Planctomycetes bacterium RBG_13_62_9]|nr:MAG: hypothetical protein A2Y77_02590 [Planctomycetes bacterium RBG_13_62_9]